MDNTFEFENRIAEFIKSNNLIEEGQTIIAALSGGADSVALLTFLNSIKNKLNINLIAVHINHNLRGEESLRDEIFTRELCSVLNIPLSVYSEDVKNFANEKKISIELAAREIRYDCFKREAAKYENSIVATAHTMSDNAETVLYNMIRGTGAKGLCGIPRDTVKNGVRYIRPLLCVDREGVLSYLKSKNMSFVEDSSNKSNVYTRNKLRNVIIKFIKEEINPSFEKNISNLSESLFEDEKYFDIITKEAFDNVKITDEENRIVLSVSGLLRLKGAILSRVIKLCLERFKKRGIENIHINSIINILNSNGFKRVALPEPLKVYKSQDRLIIQNYEEELKEFNINLKIGENYINGLGTIYVFDNETNKVNNLLIKEFIDCDRISNNLIARSRKEGDSIAFNNGHKSLKKLFIDKKIPKELRNKIPVICDGDRPIAVLGFGVDKYYKVKNSTKKTLIIGFKESKI